MCVFICMFAYVFVYAFMYVHMHLNPAVRLNTRNLINEIPLISPEDKWTEPVELFNSRSPPGERSMRDEWILEPPEFFIVLSSGQPLRFF